MKSTMRKSASIFAVAAVAGTVGSLAAAVPAQAATNCTFTNNTIAIQRTDGMMLVPTVAPGGKSVAGDAVLFSHQDGPFTEFDKRKGSASGSLPGNGAKFDIDYNGPIDFDGHNGSQHYIGFITTSGGGTGWIQGSNPQISFTVPDGQMSCSDQAAAGAEFYVLEDVRLFEKPDQGDTGKDLKKNDKVTLNGPCPIVSDGPDNGWCEVNDITLGLSGAVWGDAISK
ncbi:hypothetical protein [Mycolicibacterium stellerae]|uniref:hypothetical protein n=1 Tax=Mycolicibacterium stellerae TaxID=2358193 RepID=UPI0013DDCA2C|nr:hypothetical protein [Mycolicibacterium stellerae]